MSAMSAPERQRMSIEDLNSRVPFLRLIGAGHLAAGALLASVGPLHTLSYWPAGILLAVGLYLIVRR